MQVKSYNISLVQCYAPTTQADDAEINDALQDIFDSIPNREDKFLMGDLNANVGKTSIANNCIGKFGLGEQNE